MKEQKLEPMSDNHFKGMVWWYKIKDLIWNLQKHLGKIPLKEGMTVVDYGCGSGRYTIPVAKLVGEKGKVFALDIHPLAISIVKKKATNEDLTSIEAILVDSYDTGIKESTIDLILLIDTFHHVSDQDALLHEIHRILKQDGLLFMDPGHMKLKRAIEIVESNNLFTIVECQGQDMLVAPKTEQ